MAKRVPVVTRDGTIGSVPEAELSTALRMGASLASPSEVEEARAKQVALETLGTAGAGLAAPALGVARGLSLGLSDPLITGAARLYGGEEAQAKAAEVLRGTQAISPIVSGSAEVLGNLAPMIFSGGTAGAAGAAVKGAGALGRAAESVAARALARTGAEASALGRIGTKILTTAAGQAAEMSAYGAGHAISESALHNKALTAEELLTDMGGAAALGGLLAMPIGGTLGLASEAGRAFTRGGEALVKGGGEAWAKASEAGAAAVEKAPALAEKFDSLATDAVKKLVDIEGLSNSQAVRAVSGGNIRQQLVKEAEKMFKPLEVIAADGTKTELAGGMQGVGEVLKRRKVIDVSEGVAGNARLAEDVVDRVSAAREQVNKEIGELYAKSNAKVRVRTLTDFVEDRAATFEKMAGFENVGRELRDYAASVAEHTGALTPKGKIKGNVFIDVQEARQRLSHLRQLAYPERVGGAISLEPSKGVQELRKVVREWDDLLENTIVQEGRVSRESLDLLNRDSHALRLAEKMGVDAAERGMANRTLSMSDYLTGVGGMAFAGPVGGLAAIANKIARERGSGALSVFLHDLAETNSLRKTLTKAIKEAPGSETVARLQEQLRAASDRLGGATVLNRVAEASNRVRSDVGAAVKNVAHQVEAAKQAGLPAKIGRGVLRGIETFGRARNVAVAHGYFTVADYMRRRDEIEQLSRPGVLEERMAGALEELGQTAPELTMALGDASRRAVSYLASIAPPRFQDPYSPTPMATPYRSKELTGDESAYMQAIAVVDDPRVAIHAVSDGTLTVDQAKAFRAVYPQLHQATVKGLQQELLSRPANAPPIPYQQLSRMSILMATPLDYTMTPEFLKSMAAVGNLSAADTSQAGQKMGPKVGPEGRLSAKPLGIEPMPTYADSTEAPAGQRTLS